jgi:uncharacterized protein
MPILVDGHNLIGQLQRISLSDPDDEEQLVRLLRRFAALRRGRRVVVIFDRGVYGHPAQQLSGFGVEAHFVLPPRNADQELIARIRKVKRGAEWQLVSSDRAVAGEARAHGLTVISAQEFARKLEQLDLPRANLQQKRNDRPLTKAEIEEWMRLFGVNEADDPDVY